MKRKISFVLRSLLVGSLLWLSKGQHEVGSYGTASLAAISAIVYTYTMWIEVRKGE